MKENIPIQLIRLTCGRDVFGVVDGESGFRAWARQAEVAVRDHWRLGIGGRPREGGLPRCGHAGFLLRRGSERDVPTVDDEAIRDLSRAREDGLNWYVVTVAGQ